MEHLKQSRLSKILGIAMLSTMVLYGVSKSAPVNAGSYPGLDEEVCMADAFIKANDMSGLPQDALNCTANDVEITRIYNESIDYCNPGDIVSFKADVTIRTNAAERYDTTFYNSLSGQSPQVVQTPILDENGVEVPLSMPDGDKQYFPYYCSLLLPKSSDVNTNPSPKSTPNVNPLFDAYVDIDGDRCADITKSNGPDSYTLEGQDITMLCEDVDKNGTADFRYCAAWDNIERNNCSELTDPPGQVPNTKSKCNCDILNTDIFVKPNPPDISKTLESESDSAPEPGTEFEYSVSFKNENKSSLFITSVIDHIDVGANGTYSESGDESLNLWGDTTDPTTIDENTPEGAYLTSTTCQKPAVDANSVEVVSGGTYSCNFKVYIVARDLPGGSYDADNDIYNVAPSLPFNDVVALTFVDEYGDAVEDGETCPTGLTFDETGVEGRFCSNEETVKITNLPPDITVTKTPMIGNEVITYILEPGQKVTFNVEVINNAKNDEIDKELWDSPLTLTSLSDNIFDILDDDPGKLAVESTDCKTGVTIAANSKYTCSFTAWVTGDYGDDPHKNTVTAIARDFEYSTDKKMATATLGIYDVPSEITLTKTAGDAADGVTLSIPETGDNPDNYEDVVFKFVFSVESDSVDDVKFYSLKDVVTFNGEEGEPVDLTNRCLIDWKKAADGTESNPNVELINTITLQPGESASCNITLSLQGNAGDTYSNSATIYGIDTDDVEKEATDPADILFKDEALQITPKFALKARAFVRIPNGSNENVDITSLKIGGIDLADQSAALQEYIDFGTVPASKFLILNEADYTYGDIIEIPFCSLGKIGYGKTYDCAFTIMFFSGFADIGNVVQQFSGDSALKVLLDDDESSEPISAQVGLEFRTNEPVAP